jgi:hypothetical protein
MTNNIRRVIREPLKLQRLRRNYRQQQGVYRKTYLAAVNGRVLGTKLGHLWVHDAASADGSGNVTYGAPYQLPIKPGASIAHRPNWKVNVVTIEGDEFIESMDVNEMLRANFDPHQTNPLDPSLQFKLIENLQNLQAFPNGDATVRVMPSIYRKADGTYDIFATIDTDILTGNVPSADNQVVVCLWLKTDNTIEVTVSSEEPASTNLKLDPTTALTLINECAAAATVGALGIWSFIIWDDTTAITGINKFHDLRGIVGSGIHSILDNLTATTAPTVNDDSDAGYSVGSRWFDVTNDKIYLCIDATVGAAVWIEVVGRTQIQTLTNKTISASANTVTVGAGVAKTISDPGDAIAAGTDRSLIVSANSGTADNLIEVTDLLVGESVLLVAASGHTITVKHNDAGATVKIHLHGNADIVLDELNPLRLTLIATNVLSEDVQGSGAALPVVDTTAIVKGSVDATKQVRIEADGITAGQTRVGTMPDTDITFIGGSVAAGTVGTTDNAFIRSDGTGGNKVQGSTNANLDDSGNAAFNGLTLTNGLALQYLSDAGAALFDSIFHNGVNWDIRNNAFSSSAPTVNDDSSNDYYGGSFWVRTSTRDAYILIDDAVGAADWLLMNNQYVADGIAFTDPTTPSWTNLNHGGGTYTESTTNKRLTILEDGDGSADIRGWYTATPSVPYEIRMNVRMWSPETTSNGLCVGFREAATGELHVFSIFNNAADLQFVVQKWNSATSFSANYIATTSIRLLPHWIKIADDNTNRVISISEDGIVWTQIHSIGRTDFLTADGIFFGTFVTTNATYDTQVSLLSYEEL